MPRSERRKQRSSRRTRLYAVAGGLVVLLAVLAAIVLPLVGVPGDATRAKNALTSALEALRTGDDASARDSVEEARERVDAAQTDLGRWGTDVLSVLPVAGTAVDDARHLTQVLDEATAVAELGIGLYPEVAGPDATLFRAGTVDEDTLDRVVAAADRAEEHLLAAQESLQAVEGTTPVVGDQVAARRDEAAAQVDPLVEGLQEAAPLLDELHTMFGFEGEQTYLVALLNPAELRYSGGAALSYAPMRWDEGVMELGETVVPIEDAGLRTPLSWRKVQGNPFHRRDTFLANSTFAPSWSVSGQELVRAWRAGRGKRHDGVIAVDVVALSGLLGASGGTLEVPGGQVDATSLVETLVGSYDDYYPDATAQDAVAKAVVPQFTADLVGGGNYVAKLQALRAAAAGRHFATYFRDEELQAGMAALGLSGDLAPPEGDYLGVFSQNINGSKSDYHQRRDVSLEVALDEDGSASNRLAVRIDNATPPYVPPGEDPGVGYFTRWSELSLGVFLPDGVRVRRATVDGEAREFDPRTYYDHDYVAHRMELEPATAETLRMAYRVPDAAVVDDGGDRLTYRLAMDPQGTVNDASLTTQVRLPEGWTVPALPEGWVADGPVLTYQAPTWAASQSWEIVAVRDGDGA